MLSVSKRKAVNPTRQERALTACKSWGLAPAGTGGRGTGLPGAAQCGPADVTARRRERKKERGREKWRRISGEPATPRSLLAEKTRRPP